jgi:hypothetical protein
MEPQCLCLAGGQQLRAAVSQPPGLCPVAYHFLDRKGLGRSDGKALAQLRVAGDLAVPVGARAYGREPEPRAQPAVLDALVLHRADHRFLNSVLGLFCAR